MKTVQVKFFDSDNNCWCGGILVNDEYIICGCCGSVFYLSELDSDKIIYFQRWVNISDEIIREG